MRTFWRNLGAAVLGYVVSAVAVFCLMSVMWIVLGADGAFRPGSWDVSGGWIAGSIAIGLFAAGVGGIVCSKVAADRRGLWLLIVVVVVLGVLSALPEAPVAAGTRDTDVGMFDAMMLAAQPGWLPWLNPLLGAVGVYFGARLVKGD